jgi:hypothetical protein
LDHLPLLEGTCEPALPIPPADPSSRYRDLLILRQLAYLEAGWRSIDQRPRISAA